MTWKALTVMIHISSQRNSYFKSLIDISCDSLSQHGIQIPGLVKMKNDLGIATSVLRTR